MARSKDVTWGSYKEYISSILGTKWAHGHPLLPNKKYGGLISKPNDFFNSISFANSFKNKKHFLTYLKDDNPFCGNFHYITCLEVFWGSTEHHVYRSTRRCSKVKTLPLHVFQVYTEDIGPFGVARYPYTGCGGRPASLASMLVSAYWFHPC